MLSAVSEEDIRKNYSKVGTNLIEQLYGDDFLSLSGVESSDAMVEATGIDEHTQVLDVGCGVGGPSLHLAERTGCHVTGIDLMEWHAEEAASRAAKRGLSDNTSFHAGNAVDLPFAASTFDVVWSQDAWCHVPEKEKVVNEAARVVKPGGYVAFTDWVALDDMDPDYLATVQAAIAAANYATPDQYLNWLESAGCSVLESKDISHHFAARYQTMMANLSDLEETISEQFSPRVFAIMQEKNTSILHAFEDGKMGGWQFIAKTTG